MQKKINRTKRAAIGFLTVVAGQIIALLYYFEGQEQKSKEIESIGRNILKLFIYDTSHGTSSAGIIGALSNNGFGIAGIAGGDVAAVAL